ncbi:MAG: FabA-like domain protein [Verrucomicrobia bacterium]|nr:FabA-like domain protein [Verrucomicrobiota bacterium]
MTTTQLTPQQTTEITKTLKRCSPETIEAVFRFRNEQDFQALQTAICGIIERFLPAHSSPTNLIAVPDETRLMEDLGLDSLTMLEMVFVIEEALGVHIENDELRQLRTIGRVKRFIADKIAGVQTPLLIQKLTRDRILQVLPQQPPFFFLDEAEIDGDTVRAAYVVKGNESFLDGHFKNNPVMPASIVFEALGQAACLWVLETVPKRLGLQFQAGEILFASMDGAHFHRRAKPGDRLEMEQKLIKLRAPLASFEGVVMVGKEKLAYVEQMTLVFGDNLASASSGSSSGTTMNGQAPSAPPV